MYLKDSSISTSKYLRIKYNNIIIIIIIYICKIKKRKIQTTFRTAAELILARIHILHIRLLVIRSASIYPLGLAEVDAL